jgi:putative transposase
MEQMARNVTMEDSGFLINRRYLLHDRDSKYCSSFRQVIEAGSVKTLALPPRSPNLNAYAERWVRFKEECLSKLILLGEGSLRRALRHYEAHYHEERNHQGKDNVLLFALPTQAVRRTGKGAMSGAAGRPAEILCARGGVGVEAGTASRVW